VVDFRLDGKELLSIDSDLNESTSLWEIKTSLRGWNPPQVI